MDARVWRTRCFSSLFLPLCSLLLPNLVLAANFRTPNFQVTAPTEEFARQVGEAAEYYREKLSVEWTGKTMPKWSQPCPISVKVGNYPAGGATTFQFDRGEVYGWKMNVQGTDERILDSVLPHEVNHTIFACYFRRPLPRWADEGAASLIEHESEKMRLQKLAEEVTGTHGKIPLRQLLAMKDYPSDQRKVLTLYAQGYTLADYLIQRGDKRKYMAFIQAAHEKGWDEALNKFFGYKSIDHLEREHDQWVVAGCQPLGKPGELYAQVETENKPPVREPDTRLLGRGDERVKPTIRGQTPEGEPAPLPAVEAKPLGRSRATLEQPVLMMASQRDNGAAATTTRATGKTVNRKIDRFTP